MHEALLRGLEPGQVMWMAAQGRSLWPLLRDGDVLKVLRTSEFQVGDVAVVALPGGVLAAHLVVQTEPLQTASTAGLEDPPALEGLARVVGFRRAGREHAFPRSRALGAWPWLARRLKRVTVLRSWVRRLRD